MLNFIFGVVVGSSASFLIFSVFSINRIEETCEKFDDDLKNKGSHDE